MLCTFFTAFLTADEFYLSQLLRWRAAGTYWSLGNYKALTHNLRAPDTALVCPLDLIPAPAEHSSMDDYYLSFCGLCRWMHLYWGLGLGLLFIHACMQGICWMSTKLHFKKQYKYKQRLTTLYELQPYSKIVCVGMCVCAHMLVCSSVSHLE